MVRQCSVSGRVTQHSTYGRHGTIAVVGWPPTDRDGDYVIKWSNGTLRSAEMESVAVASCGLWRCGLGAWPGVRRRIQEEIKYLNL